MDQISCLVQIQPNALVPTIGDPMTIQDDRTVIQQPVDEGGRRGPVAQTLETRRLTRSPSAAEYARRIILLVFGLVQVVILLRILLLLLDARTGNDIVSSILNVSQVFVGPFEGILRTDALHNGGSMLDVTAVVALVGWTILEAIVLWVVAIFRRERATA